LRPLSNTQVHPCRRGQHAAAGMQNTTYERSMPEPVSGVVVNGQFETYWSLSLHNDIVQISLIIVMLRKTL
jgi:hypothetical protein